MQLRARFDIIVVLDVDGQAVQCEMSTVLRDQLELTKRFPKAADEPALAPMRIAWIAAQRAGVSPAGESFDAFVDRCIDMQIDEPPPLTKG